MTHKPNPPLPLWARIIEKGLILHAVIWLAASVALAHHTWTNESSIEALRPVQFAQVKGGAA
jgi:hypothetical protein